MTYQDYFWSYENQTYILTIVFNAARGINEIKAVNQRILYSFLDNNILD